MQIGFDHHAIEQNIELSERVERGDHGKRGIREPADANIVLHHMQPAVKLGVLPDDAEVGQITPEFGTILEFRPLGNIAAIDGPESFVAMCRPEFAKLRLRAPPALLAAVQIDIKASHQHSSLNPNFYRNGNPSSISWQFPMELCGRGCCDLHYSSPIDGDTFQIISWKPGANPEAGVKSTMRGTWA